MFEQFGDSKHAASIESVGTAAGEAMTAAVGTGGDDAAAGDIGGDDLGTDDLGGGDTGDTPAADDAEEEGPLLAEPGQRSDNGYEEVKLDGRQAGARLRSYLASAGESVASSSDRNLYKGGSGEMRPLSRGTVGEALDREEILLKEANNDVLRLIQDLEKNNEN